MKHVYNVIREWEIFNKGTQYNVLGVYTDLSDAEDAADEAAKYGGSDEDRGYVGITRHELNPERVSTMNDTGYPVGR